jgi:hypothetical protein
LGEEEAERAACQPQHQAFRQQFKGNATATRAERRADRKLTLASLGAYQQEIRDVGPRHQEHDGHGA